MLSVLLFLPLCLYFWAIDFAVLSMIWLFQDVSRWRLRKIVKDLGRALKGNSYRTTLAKKVIIIIQAMKKG